MSARDQAAVERCRTGCAFMADSRVVPCATCPSRDALTAAKCSRCGLTNCSCVGGHGGPLRPTPFGCSEEYAKAAGDQYRNAKHAESVVMFR